MANKRVTHIIMEDGVECKKCYKCLRLKPLKDFYADPKASDGLYNICKTCWNKNRKERRWGIYWEKRGE